MEKKMGERENDLCNDVLHSIGTIHGVFHFKWLPTPTIHSMVVSLVSTDIISEGYGIEEFPLV
jgi:hypothetical protein